MEKETAGKFEVTEIGAIPLVLFVKYLDQFDADM
jgi:hypothetical protein